MKKHELSYGFSPEDTEEEIRQKYGDEAAQLFIEQRRKTAHWTQKKWDDFNARYEKLAQKFAYARDKGLKPESKEVQKLVKELVAVVKIVVGLLELLELLFRPQVFSS